MCWCSWDISVTTVPRQHDGRPRNHSLISSTDRRHFYSPKRPGEIWRSFSLPFYRCRWLFHRSAMAEVKLITYLHVVPNLRMNGAVPLLPHMQLWRAQQQFQLYLYIQYLQFCIPEGIRSPFRSVTAITLLSLLQAVFINSRYPNLFPL